MRTHTALATFALVIAACSGPGDGEPAANEATHQAQDAGAEATAAPSSDPASPPSRAAERPEGLPEDVPLPITLRNVTSTGSAAGTSQWSGSVDGEDVAGIRDALAADLQAAGWAVEATGTESAVGLDATSGPRRYRVSITSLGVLGSVQLSYTEE